MATSGTYGFSPEIAELCDEAFERVGIDPETLTARHIRSARRSLNLLLSDWATKGCKLWTVDTQTVPMVQGTATYNCPGETIALLEVTLRSNGIDTIITPMARDEYMYTPDKTSQGFPSRYYFDRQRTVPTVTLWQVPNNSTDTLRFTRFRRLQDVGAASNQPEIPYLWQEALTAGWAAKIAEKYNPEREGALFDKSAAAFDRADVEDRQRTPTRIRVNYR